MSLRFVASALGFGFGACEPTYVLRKRRTQPSAGRINRKYAATDAAIHALACVRSAATQIGKSAGPKWNRTAIASL